MGCIVGSPELRRPPPRQSLALVAAGEEGKPLGIAGADLAEPAGRDRHRFVPAYLLELAAAARTYPQQWAGEPGRRVVIHQPGGALGAEHALVHGVVAVAL